MKRIIVGNIISTRLLLLVLTNYSGRFYRLRSPWSTGTEFSFKFTAPAIRVNFRETCCRSRVISQRPV